MKSFLQLMPVLLSFYFLSSSVSCALDANEYLKSDMFDFSFNRLNILIKRKTSKKVFLL